MNNSQKQTGGCQCGDVRYEITGAPVDLYLCHCRECQKQSSSAFGISYLINQSSFRLTQGDLKFWTRPTDSGNLTKCAFCPNCGTRVWHARVGSTDIYSIKGGTLDQSPDISKVDHIWTGSKFPGVSIPKDAQQFTKEPD